MKKVALLALACQSASAFAFTPRSNVASGVAKQQFGVPAVSNSFK